MKLQIQQCQTTGAVIFHYYLNTCYKFQCELLHLQNKHSNNSVGVGTLASDVPSATPSSTLPFVAAAHFYPTTMNVF